MPSITNQNTLKPVRVREYKNVIRNYCKYFIGGNPVEYLMAIILHKQSNQEIDLFKVIKMLLVHDLVEIDAGDTFAYDTNGHIDKFDREVNAAKRLFGMLPGNELMDLWLEFEAKDTNEAKFAASLDRLQPLIHNHLNHGDTWKKYGITSEQVIQRNSEIANGSETLWEFAEHIIKKSVDQGILCK